MTSPKAAAEEMLPLLDRVKRDFDNLPDLSGAQIHCLFAGLYCQTAQYWLQTLEQSDRPDFAYLVVRDFYDIYEIAVPEFLVNAEQDPPRPWRKYHWLARRLTMRAPISAHLLLLIFGARAHIRHDLRLAIIRSAPIYRQLTGDDVQFEALKHTITGPASARAFYAAAISFVQWHRVRQTGWRRFILGVYLTVLRLLRPFWVGVMEGWRRRAWRDAMRVIKNPQ